MNESDVYDDACNLGQFCMNPCLTIFTKLQQAVYYSKRGARPKKTAANDTFASPVAKKTLQKKQQHGPNTQQIGYAVAVHGSWAVVFLRLYPLQQALHQTAAAAVPDYHRYLGYLTFVLCIASWSLATFVRAGNITESTLSQYDNYPYDNILYTENTVCPTLKIRKLARSKYDRYSGKHVPRFDHFCGWLNCSIGEENYRFFLLFLVVHTGMCIYGSTLILCLVQGAAAAAAAAAAIQNDEPRPISLHRSVLAFVAVDYILAALLVFMLAMSVTLALFLGFHLRNVSNGMTTNEWYKWRIVAEQHALQRTITKDEETAPHDPVSFPINNIYNLGFVKNFKEVLFPRSFAKKRELAREKKF